MEVLVLITRKWKNIDIYWPEYVKIVIHALVPPLPQSFIFAINPGTTFMHVLFFILVKKLCPISNLELHVKFVHFKIAAFPPDFFFL